MNDVVADTVAPATEQIGRAIVVAGCVFEVVALTTQKIPTITAVVHSVGRRGLAGRLVVWAIGGFVAFHFMEKLS